MKYMNDSYSKALIRSSIHGGRCVAYGRVFNDSDNPLIPFDANSLYPTAMEGIEQFPDIMSAVKLDSASNYLDYPFYIINCDVELPKHLRFVPVCN